MNPHYEFTHASHLDGATPTDLDGTKFWHDSGTTDNGEVVYWESSGQYAYWNNGSSWFVTPIGDVGGAGPTGGYFLVAGTSLVAGGGWAGTGSILEYSIANAWDRAEETAFESLRNFVGGTEGKDCFRGFLPVAGDGADDKLVDVWQLTSGESSEFEIDRLKGADASWCSLRSDARVESLWRNRDAAMRFAGAVTAWLQETNNLNEVGNVTWCTMASIPDEPEIHRTDGPKNRQRYWRQTIDLELVYTTGTNYN